MLNILLILYYFTNVILLNNLETLIEIAILRDII